MPPNPAKRALRKLLKLERQKAELTQAQSAERLGWDQRTISNIEAGEKRVIALELIAIANAVGFDPAAAIRRVAKVPEE